MSDTATPLVTESSSFRRLPGVVPAAVAVLLLLLSAAYFARGIKALYTGEMSSDIRDRHHWVQRTLAGQTPWKLNNEVTPDPPTSFVGNFIEFGLPPPFTRIFYVAMFCATVLFLAGFGFQLGRRHGTSWGLLLASGVTCISALCTTLGIGQNSVFATGLVVAALVLDRRRFFIASGLCLGVALSKPQIAGMFILPLFFKLRVKTLVTAASVCLGGMAVMCLLVHRGPVAVTDAYLDYMWQVHNWPGYGAMQWLEAAGFSTARAQTICAVFFGLLTSGYVFLRRRDEMFLLFAVTSVTGRLWAYHQLYDNEMVVLLLLFLGRAAAARGTLRATIPFLLVGLTLWAPGKATDHVPFQVFQTVIWLGGAIYVAFTYRTNDEIASRPVKSDLVS